jgi:hypothetical protein
MTAPDIEPVSLQINRSHTTTPCSLTSPPHEIVGELPADARIESRRCFSSRETESNESSNDTTYFSDHVTHSDPDVGSEVVGYSREADADEVKSHDNSQPALSPIDLSTSIIDANLRGIGSTQGNQTLAAETANHDSDRSRQSSTGSKSLYHSIQELSLPSNTRRNSEPDSTYVASAAATEFNGYYCRTRTAPVEGHGYNGGDLDASFGEEADVIRAGHPYKDYQDYNENFDGRSNAAKCSVRSENVDSIIYPCYSTGIYSKDSHFHHCVRSMSDFDNHEAMHPHVEQASFWNKVADAGDTSSDVHDGARRYSVLHMTKTDDDDGVLAKRARMENIVNSLRASSPQQRTSSPPLSSDADDARCLKRDAAQSSPTHASVMTSFGEWDATTRRSKRKRYVPQQHDGWRTDDAVMKSAPSVDDVRSDDDVMTEKSTAAAALLRAETISVREQLQTIEDRLSEMHTKCLMSFTADLPLDRMPKKNVADDDLRAATSDDLETDAQRNGIRRARVEASTPEVESRTNMMTSLPFDERLIKLLKAEIDRSVGTLIDNVVRAFVDRYIASRSQRQHRETSRDHRSVDLSTNSNNNSEMAEDRQAKARPLSTDLTSHSLLRQRPSEAHPGPPVGGLPVLPLPAALLAAAPTIPFPFPVDIDDHLGRSLLAERLQSAMCGHALDSRSTPSTGLNFSLSRAVVSGSGRDMQTSRSVVSQPGQVALSTPNEFATAAHLSSAGQYTPQQQQHHQATHRFYRRVSLTWC